MTRWRSRSAPTVALFEVIVVLQAVAPDHVHQAQGERGVGAGARLDVPVGAPGGRAPVGVDRDDRRAGLAAPRSSSSRDGCWCWRCSSPS